MFFRGLQSPGEGQQCFFGDCNPLAGDSNVFSGIAIPRRGTTVFLGGLQSPDRGQPSFDPSQVDIRGFSDDQGGRHALFPSLGPYCCSMPFIPNRIAVNIASRAQQRRRCCATRKSDRRCCVGIYQFQIRALGVLGYTDWMDPKTFVVA